MGERNGSVTVQQVRRFYTDYLLLSMFKTFCTARLDREGITESHWGWEVSRELQSSLREVTLPMPDRNVFLMSHEHLWSNRFCRVWAQYSNLTTRLQSGTSIHTTSSTPSFQLCGKIKQLLSVASLWMQRAALSQSIQKSCFIQWILPPGMEFLGLHCKPLNCLKCYLY